MPVGNGVEQGGGFGERLAPAVEPGTHLMMRLASVRAPAARLARRGLMTLAAGAQRFSQSGLLLGAGVNPAEGEWLRPLGARPRD